MTNLCDACVKTLSCPVRDLKIEARKLGVELTARECPEFESQVEFLKRRGLRA